MRPFPGGRVAAALTGVLCGVLAALAAPAGQASAHAVLTATTPERGSVVATPPTAVRLTFSEPVRVVHGRTQVIAPNGKRIHDGDPTGSGTRLTIALRATDRPLGTYLVSFRVIAVDGHPVTGTFTFSVGAPSATPTRPAGDGPHPIVAVAVPITTYLGYGGLALLVGPLLLLLTLWPRRLSSGTPLHLIRLGLVLLAASAVAALWLQAPYLTGAGPLEVSAVELREVATGRTGAALVCRLLVVAVVAVLLGRAVAGGRGPDRPTAERVGAEASRDRDRAKASRDGGRARGFVGGDGARAGRDRGRARWALLTAGVAGLLTWPLAGHPAAGPLPVAGVLAGAIHLAAMAVWLGGLLALGPLLRRADRRELAIILPVWSRWATLAVYWLVAAGVVRALTEVGGPAALTDTGYGRLVLVKAGLLVLVLAVAAYSRWWVRRRGGGPEPAAHRDGQSAEDPAPDRRVTSGRARVGQATGGRARVGRGRLRRAVLAEVGIAALVLAVSAVLVRTTPGRSVGAEAIATAGATGFSTTLTSSLYAVQFEVFPAQVGTANTLHAFLYTPAGVPLRAVEWKVTGDLPDAGLEPVDNPVVPIRDNQGIGSVAFPVAGRWRLRLTIRVSDTEQATVSTTIMVR